MEKDKLFEIIFNKTVITNNYFEQNYIFIQLIVKLYTYR